jgi:Domain of unknown function (DUF6487)
MKCPRCGKEMEEGFVSAYKHDPMNPRLGWSKTKVHFAPNREELLNTEHMREGYVFTKAFRCHDCRLIQFEY